MPTQAREFLSKAVDASEAVADELASAFRVEVDPSDVSEVAGMLASKMRREAFTAANGAKFERELNEKYGMLKDVILHPTVQVRCAVCVGYLVAVEARGVLSSLPRLRSWGLLCIVFWYGMCCWTYQVLVSHNSSRCHPSCVRPRPVKN